jgi:hypothetical protein
MNTIAVQVKAKELEELMKTDPAALFEKNSGGSKTSPILQKSL